jgi:hypothetical protein
VLILYQDQKLKNLKMGTREKELTMKSSGSGKLKIK